jgi:hypothetical protein
MIHRLYFEKNTLWLLGKTNQITYIWALSNLQQLNCIDFNFVNTRDSACGHHLLAYSNNSSFLQNYELNNKAIWLSGWLRSPQPIAFGASSMLTDARRTYPRRCGYRKVDESSHVQTALSPPTKLSGWASRALQPLAPQGEPFLKPDRIRKAGTWPQHIALTGANRIAR